MYEIEVKDLASHLEPVLAIIGQGEEIVLTESQRPIAKITRIAESDLPEAANRGEEMARILEQLAALNAFADIPDPASWQREIRQDRSLPGRE